MSQGDLFNRPAAEAARDKAIADVHRGAAEWVETVLGLVERMPIGRRFVTDDLWRLLGDETPVEPRAMGAAIRLASVRGLIAATGEYRKSERVICHARPMAVWERTQNPKEEG